MDRLTLLRQRGAIAKHLREHGAKACKPGEALTLSPTWWSCRNDRRFKHAVRAIGSGYSHKTGEDGSPVMHTKNIEKLDAR